MSCRSVQAELVAVHFGELDAAASRGVQVHLAACPACAAEAATIERVLAAVTAEVVFPGESQVDWSTPLTCMVARVDASTVMHQELGEPRRAELLAHLARCPDCARESAAIAATLTAVGESFPDEDRVDWDAFARQTARLAMAEVPRKQARLSPLFAALSAPLLRPTVALPLAASLLAGIGIAWLASRTSHLPPTPPGTPFGETARADEAPIVSAPLLQRTQLELAKSDAARYLTDSGQVFLSLTELPGPCGRDHVDVSTERELSRRLLRRKQLLQGDLDDVELARAHRLADEVEHLLSDIASLDKCVPPDRLREIGDVARRRQLLLRIEMITSELETGGTRA